MSYIEPVVVFVASAAKGRKLAIEKDWLFCGRGSTGEVAAITAEAFRNGLKDGIVLTYGWVGFGINWRRPNTQLVLINRPNRICEEQAVNAVRPISISRIASVSELGNHRCRCPIQTLNLQGCQCGGE
jgi:hypothetical protein